jgi:hypothetical protein
MENLRMRRKLHAARRLKRSADFIVEAIERRVMLTATAVATVPGYEIQYSGVNSDYMAVGLAHGTGGSDYSSFGVISVPISSLEPNYTVNTGTTPYVSSLTLNLFNASTTGTYAPVAGSFDVYVLPDNDTSTSGPSLINYYYLRYGTGTNATSGNVATSTATGLASLGSTFGTTDAASLGVTSADLAGTFTANTAAGYSSYTLSSLSSGAQSIIAQDINAFNAGSGANNTPITLAIVPSSGSTPGYEEFGGSLPVQQPMVSLNVTSTTSNVAEQFGVGYTSVNAIEPATSGSSQTTYIDVDRTGYLNDTATVKYATANGTASSSTNYTATSGTLTFAPGITQMEIPVTVLGAASTTDKTFTVTLSSPTSNYSGTDAVTVPSSTATSTVTIVGNAANTFNVSKAPASLTTDEETSGYFSATTSVGVEGSPNNGTGAANYPEFMIAEFDDSGTTGTDLFPPTGSSVTSLTNLSLGLVNSGSTSYPGKAGDFNVYYLPNSTTTSPTAASVKSGGFAFNPLAVDGVAGQGGALLIGTFSYDVGTAAESYTPASLSSAVIQDLEANLNAGAAAGNAVRLAIAPGSPGFFAYLKAGASVTLSLADTVAQTKTPENFTFASAAPSVPETSLSQTIQVKRSGATTDTAHVTYTTADGTALNGINYAATSGTLTFAPGITTENITIPIYDVSPQGGDKAFRVTLTGVTVSGSTTIGVLGSGTQSASSLAAIDTITDMNTAPRQTLTQLIQDQSDIETSGPYATTSVYITGSTGAYPAIEAFDFNDEDAPNGVDNNGSPIYFTPASTVTAINSLSLTLTQESTGLGTSGPLDVFLVPQNNDGTYPIDAGTSSTYAYNTTAVTDPTTSGGTGAKDGLGTQFGTPVLLGRTSFDATATGGTTETLQLIDYNAGAESTLISAINGQLPFRLVLTPESPTTSVFAEGVYTYTNTGTGATTVETPQISLNVSEAPAVPAWLTSASTSNYTWNPTTEMLNVTGPVTINADPAAAAEGGDLPQIVGSGSSAVVTISPSTSDVDVHLGGITLTNGGQVVVPSVSNRTASSHPVLVLDVVNSIYAPTFSIDSTSKLDLGSNDMIIHQGSLSSVQTLAEEGRDPTSGVAGNFDGTWDGKGLTSSAAAAADASSGYEEIDLGVVKNADLQIGQLSSWTVGGAVEPLRADGNDIIVKYTYFGDAALEGVLSDDDVAIVNEYYSDTVPVPSSDNDYWAFGAFEGNGFDNDDSVGIVNAYYDALPQL